MKTLALILMLIPAIAWPADITLMWTANPEPDIAGYLIRYGPAAGHYTEVVRVTEGATARITGLLPGRTYFFCLSAYNVAGLESPRSEELTYRVPGRMLAAPGGVRVHE